MEKKVTLKDKSKQNFIKQKSEKWQSLSTNDIRKMNGRIQKTYF